MKWIIKNYKNIMKNNIKNNMYKFIIIKIQIKY